jgi:hypothetical protein
METNQYLKFGKVVDYASEMEFLSITLKELKRLMSKNEYRALGLLKFLRTRGHSNYQHLAEAIIVLGLIIRKGKCSYKIFNDFDPENKTLLRSVLQKTHQVSVEKREASGRNITREKIVNESLGNIKQQLNETDNRPEKTPSINPHTEGKLESVHITFLWGLFRYDKSCNH